MAGERRQLLLLAHDFDALREHETARWIDTVEAAWTQEEALRARDTRQGGLPRLVFETSRGEVTVELFTRDAPGLTAALQALVKRGGFTDARCIWATGGIGAAFDAPKAPKDAKPSGRRAWRGTLALVARKSGKLRLIFTTGHVHLYRSATAIGRVIDGQEHVDRLGSEDSIRAARAP